MYLKYREKKRTSLDSFRVSRLTSPFEYFFRLLRSKILVAHVKGAHGLGRKHIPNDLTGKIANKVPTNTLYLINARLYVGDN